MVPIDYFRDVQSPFQAALQGYSAGAAIRNDQQQQDLQQQQQAAALAQQQQQQRVISGLISNPNPTAQDYARATLLVPGLREQFKQSWDQLNEQQQQSHLSDASQWYSAVSSGRPDIAVDAMMERAKAMEAAAGGPTKQSQAIKTQASIIEAHPEFGRTQIGLMLSSLPGGDKVLSGATTMGTEGRTAALFPSVALKSQAEASEAATKAGIANSTAPAKIAAASLENDKTAQEIETAKSQRQIAALNVQIAQANSETERGNLTLKRDELQQKINQTAQTQATETQTTMDTLGNTLATIDSLMKHPGLTGEGASWSGGAGTILGKLRANIPGSEDKDFRAQLDTLKSQEFLTSIQQMKGMGALSDAEGAKVSSAVANLDPDQSVGQLKNALGVIRATVARGQAKLIASGKLAPAGGAFVMTHPQFGNVSEGDINRMLKNNPGSTRDQVIKFLQSTGGK